MKKRKTQKLPLKPCGRKYLGSAVALMALACCLGGCRKAVSDPVPKDEPTAAGSETKAQNSTAADTTVFDAEAYDVEGIEWKNGVIRTGDLTNAQGWLGMTFSELGLTDAAADEDIVKLQGRLLGEPAEGSVYLFEQNAAGERVISEINLYMYKPDFSVCFEQLKELYGGPVDYDMEPYAESNGGAVERYRFDAGPVLVSLAQASKRNYSTITFAANPNPGYQGTLQLKPARQELFGSSDLKLSAGKADFDNGVLTLHIQNTSGDVFTVTDTWTLYEKREDDGYDSMFPVGMMLRPEQSFELEDGAEMELLCDLRDYGKLIPGKYMIDLDGRCLEFELEGTS